MGEFAFNLCASCVRVLYSAVERSKSEARREEAAMKAAKRILEGSRSLPDLKAIATWKSHRPIHHLEKNSAKCVETILNCVTSENLGEKESIEKLTKLRGVNIPMASAILSFIHPEKFTVIDVRALDALGIRDAKINIDLYIRYLKFCRKTSQALGVTLRELDRALWKAGAI